VLRVALHDAEADGLIGPATVNAAKRVRTPRVVATRPEATPMHAARAIITALRGDPLEPLVTTAIGTGLRQGELLGLRWQDVDLDATVLHVRHQLQRIDGAYALRAPKTADSQAPVPLPAFVVERLRAHRAAQNALRLQAGADWIDQDLVFCTARGTPLNGSAVTHTFQKRLVAAGVAPLRFHDLRHAAASLVFAAGASMKEVQVILRHSRLSTTADIYTAVAAELGHDAMRQLDRDFRDGQG
jgi:integrase